MITRPFEVESFALSFAEGQRIRPGLYKVTPDKRGQFRGSTSASFQTGQRVVGSQIKTHAAEVSEQQHSPSQHHLQVGS
jgi:hypothetical protein